MAVNFDPVARAYRGLEYFSFGPLLGRCRAAHLAHLGHPRRALIFGDGDGRFLAHLLRLHPSLLADSVDSSLAMLALQKKRAASTRRIHFHHADALAFTPPHRDYDLLVTHFFLDCLTPPQLFQLCHQIQPHLAPAARWLVSDFSIPHNRLCELPARALVNSLYFAFRHLTGLQTRQLPDHAAVLRQQKWTLVSRRPFLASILISQLWQREPSV